MTDILHSWEILITAETECGLSGKSLSYVCRFFRNLNYVYNLSLISKTGCVSQRVVVDETEVGIIG